MRMRRKSLSRSLGIKKSASFGPKGSKINVSSRGIRATTKNPITGKRRSKTIASSKSGCAGCGTTSGMMLLISALVIKKVK